MKNWESLLSGLKRGLPLVFTFVVLVQCEGACSRLWGECGDGVCFDYQGYENPENCPEDCGQLDFPDTGAPTPGAGAEEPGVIEAIPNICGDGICNTMTENTDLCPDDCECVDDGECSPGEGFNCLDCGDVSRYCGQSCTSSEDCRGILSCFEGVCWETCACTGQCDQEGESGGGASCVPCGAPCQEHCNSPDTFCDEGCCRCP
jgi:hypothetical protein